MNVEHLRRALITAGAGAFLLPRLLAGQPVNAPAFTAYGMEEGLSQGSVEALFQDRDGFLWIGTHDGLNRFDGVRFRVYKHDPDDSRSLSDDFVLALAEAPDGTLWVGTERGGLNRFDPLTGRAERIPLSGLGPWRRDAGRGSTPQRRGRTVSEIIPTSDGSLILLTDAGVVRFEPEGGRTIPLMGRGRPPDDDTVLCAAAEGGALVGFSDATVVRIESERRSEVTLSSLPARVSALRCPADGSALVATVDGRVHAVDPESGTSKELFRIEGSSGEPEPAQDLLIHGHGAI